MKDLRENEIFTSHYEELKKVRLNPRRHTASNGYTHSEKVADVAGQLARQNGYSNEVSQMMENLGRAHDIGKIRGTARPDVSLQVLREANIQLSQSFLSLVKWHDTNLPWWKSARRGQAPSDKAWRRLQKEVDVSLLCLFMVADRSDAPGGWRRNEPLRWFYSEATRRGILKTNLHCDLVSLPSERCAGAVFLQRKSGEQKALLIRVRGQGFELPKGGLQWDELPENAAMRELAEESGYQGRFEEQGLVGKVLYDVYETGGVGEYKKEVRYYRIGGTITEEFPLPKRTQERIWVSQKELASLPVVHETTRTIVATALAGETV